MKIRSQNIAGGILMVTLVSSGIMGVALASYLNLVRHQNLSTMRSQQWNQALPIAEAGVEEALIHLASLTDTNRAVNGWSFSLGAYRKERWLGSNKVAIEISTDSSPIITSRGYVPDAYGQNLITTPRTVVANTTNDALWAKGMVAKGTIDLRGNNIRTDSFDSTDPAASTGGRYDPSKFKDNGDVATNSGLINSLSVGNAEIYGRASTGPGGSVSVGSSGGVGTKAWLDAGNHGVQPGRTSDDMNVSFPDVKVPFSGGASTPGSGTVGGTNYNIVVGAGNNQLTSVSMSGNQKMIVTGHAVLYVTGNFSMAGNAEILIATNASLKLYVGGTSASLAGNGVSNPGNALNFTYYGLPTNTSLSFSGNAAFTGTIYAPNANFSLGGGGTTTYDFVGASITSTVTMNGHFNFHYDEALGKVGPSRGYVVTAWNEI